MGNKASIRTNFRPSGPSVRPSVRRPSASSANADIGNKDIHKGKQLLLEQVDASLLKEGEIATFVNWGNIKIGKIEKKGAVVTKITATLQLDNTDYKKTVKVTWLGDVKADAGKTIPVVTAEYDHIISKAIIGKDEDWKQFINFDSVHYKKMVGEPAIKNVKKGDIIQIQRKGYYIVDQPWCQKSELSGVETPLLLIAIPDGHTGKENEKAITAKAPAAASATSGSSGLDIYNQIEAQGTLVRELKTKDAKSQATKDAIAKLLELKKKYKEVTGSDHKPGSPPAGAPSPAAAPTASGFSGLDIYNQIDSQGNLVRELKGKDAKSQATKDAIAKLLELKKKYKEVTGSDHKPGSPPAGATAPAATPVAAPATSGSSGLDIYNQIDAQGNLVRELKTKDAKSQATKDAIAKLLELKKKYKEVTGSDHKPGNPPAGAPAPAAAPATSGSSSALDIYNHIDAQGNLVRELKTKDAKSQATKDAIVKLLELKKKYKEVTGSDHKPGSPPAGAPASAAAPASSGSSGLEIYNQIEAQGNLVRELKTKDAKSQATKDAIAKLLELKKKYKEVTGSDHKPGNPPAGATPPAATPVAAPATSGSSALDIYNQIDAQGNLVRELKGKDAKSQATKDAIAKLLELKKKYKEVTGSDHKPGNPPAPAAPAAPSVDEAALLKEIEAQGAAVRDAKAKDPKSQESADAINKLLALKANFKKVTGKDVPAPANAQSKKGKKK
uniref:WHEP-TRS domain-containing protein n=1 Tax=Caenorhabditis japonica TaxID=281687 RepID=A0A8R1HYX9_CAEJA